LCPFILKAKVLLIRLNHLEIDYSLHDKKWAIFEHKVFKFKFVIHYLLKINLQNHVYTSEYPKNAKTIRSKFARSIVEAAPQNKYTVPDNGHSYRLEFFSLREPRAWNRLPDHGKEFGATSAVKARYRQNLA
jgi:hypothetical protein